MLAKELGTHLGIAMHARTILKTLLLYLAGSNDALANDGTTLTRLFDRKLTKWDGDNLDLNIIPKMEKEGYER